MLFLNIFRFCTGNLMIIEYIIQYHIVSSLKFLYHNTYLDDCTTIYRETECIVSPISISLLDCLSKSHYQHCRVVSRLSCPFWVQYIRECSTLLWAMPSCLDHTAVVGFNELCKDHVRDATEGKKLVANVAPPWEKHGLHGLQGWF